MRGEDHISNTPRQLLLYEAFGLTPPEFAHVAMVLGPDHAPLSKRHGATSVDEFRDEGLSAGGARRTTWRCSAGRRGDERGAVPLAELARRFSLSDVGHSAGVFDEEKLAWVNRHYLKRRARSAWPSFRCRTSQRAGCVTAGSRRSRVSGERRADRHTSVDRLDQVPAAAAVPVRLRPRRGADDAAIARRCERGGAARQVIDALAERARRRCHAWPTARRFAAWPTREAEDRAEGQGAVPSDSHRADRARPTGRSSTSLVPAIERGAELPIGTGIAPIVGARERAQRIRARLDPQTPVRSMHSISSCFMLIYGINPVLEALRAGRVDVAARRAAPAIDRLQQLLTLAAEQPGVPVRRVSDERARSRVGRGRCIKASSPTSREPHARASRTCRRSAGGTAAHRRARRHRGSAQLRRDSSDGRRGGRRRRRPSDAPFGGARRRGGEGSAGAVAHVKIAEVVNIARAIEELKEAGVWTVGLAGDAPNAYDAIDLTRPDGGRAGCGEGPGCGGWFGSGAISWRRSRCGGTSAA